MGVDRGVDGVLGGWEKLVLIYICGCVVLSCCEGSLLLGRQNS